MVSVLIACREFHCLLVCLPLSLTVCASSWQQFNGETIAGKMLCIVKIKGKKRSWQKMEWRDKEKNSAKLRRQTGWPKNFLFLSVSFYCAECNNKWKKVKETEHWNSGLCAQVIDFNLLLITARWVERKRREKRETLWNSWENVGIKGGNKGAQ